MRSSKAVLQYIVFYWDLTPQLSTLKKIAKRMFSNLKSNDLTSDAIWSAALRLLVEERTGLVGERSTWPAISAFKSCACVSLLMLSSPGGTCLEDAVVFLMTSLLLLFCASSTELSLLHDKYMRYLFTVYTPISHLNSIPIYTEIIMQSQI